MSSPAAGAEETLSWLTAVLDNEDLDPSELDGIKEDVDYYIEVI